MASESEKPPEESRFGSKRFSAILFDAYGFLTNKNDQNETAAWEPENNLRIDKWQQMMANWEYWSTTKSSKLKSRIRKGIPDAFRTVVWSTLVGINQKKENHDLMHSEKGFEGTYWEWLVQQLPDESISSVIDHDLNRTFPKHQMFLKKSSVADEYDGQPKLSIVLRAYACHDRELGYCQGMGFIAATFLMYYEEELAFYFLVCLMEDEKFGMRSVFLPDLPGLKQKYFELDWLLGQKYPKLYEKFQLFGIQPIFYSSKWFMTLFTYNSNFNSVLCFMDCFLHEGSKVVYRVALSILQQNQATLLACNDEEILMQKVQIMADDLNEKVLEKAFAISLSHRDLEKAAAAFHESKKEENN